MRERVNYLLGTAVPPVRSRRKCALTLLVIAASLVFSAGVVQSQEPKPFDTITIDTNLISVPVIVSDRDNRYVPNLNVEAFRLFDNQVQQRISYFDTGEEPLNVVLMLDTSLSTSGVLSPASMRYATS